MNFTHFLTDPEVFVWLCLGLLQNSFNFCYLIYYSTKCYSTPISSNVRLSTVNVSLLWPVENDLLFQFCIKQAVAVLMLRI
jgi:hypothetical protein